MLNQSYSPEQIENRLFYLVMLKQMSIANSRGYIPYNDVDGLSILWGYDDTVRITELANAIDGIFAQYSETGHLDETYFNDFIPYMPEVFVFIKYVNHQEDDVVHWLLSSTLKSVIVANRKMINVKSYEETASLLVRFSEIMIDHGEVNEAVTVVHVEVYNPLIYQGLAPVKNSQVSGLGYIESELMKKFSQSTVKVSEVTPNHMLALVSEHVFTPNVTYLGNIAPKSQVDDIYAPIMSNTEIIHERSKRLEVVMSNLPNVTLEDIERNDVVLFATINPIGSLALHYGFVRGDLVELRTIIPSGKSISSRKKGIYLVK